MSIILFIKIVTFIKSMLDINKSLEKEDFLINREHIAKIKEEIKEYIEKILWNDYIFSCIFGWIVYNKWTNNDIDLLIFTKWSIPEDKKILLEKNYIKLHKKWWLEPDFEFPWEYIEKKDLIASIRWKWFYINNDEIKIWNITNSWWNEFNTYRHNLSAFFLSEFVSWDLNTFEKIKYHCINTLVKLVLLKNKLNSFTINNILDCIIWDGKTYLWFTNNEFIKSLLLVYINFIINRWKEKWYIWEEDWYFFISNNSFLNTFKYSINKYNLTIQ